jgi:hypothetical protein
VSRFLTGKNDASTGEQLQGAASKVGGAMKGQSDAQKQRMIQALIAAGMDPQTAAMIAENNA